MAAKVGSWWLARSLYRVRCFDLAAVPPAERRAALRHLAIAWAPFDEADYRLAQSNDRGWVWAWSRRQVEDLLSEAGAESSAEILPEGLFRPAMDSDGLRMIRCVDGVELEVWRRGDLALSRWWSQAPDAAEWDVLLRGAPSVLALPRLPPDLSEVRWLSRPQLDSHPLDSTGARWSRWEGAVLVPVVLLLAVLTGRQAGAMFNVHRSIAAKESEINRVRKEAQPVLQARDRALLALTKLQSLAVELDSPKPIEVLAHLARVLPTKGVALRDLELNGLTLRLGLALDPEIQRSAVVKDLQSGGWLHDVRELGDAPGRGWVNFEMQLAGAGLGSSQGGLRAAALAAQSGASR